MAQTDSLAIIGPEYDSVQPAVIAQLTPNQIAAFKTVDNCLGYTGPYGIDAQKVTMPILRNSLEDNRFEVIHPSQLRYVSLNDFSVVKAVRERNTLVSLFEAQQSLLHLAVRPSRYESHEALPSLQGLVKPVDPADCDDIAWKQSVFGLDIHITVDPRAYRTEPKATFTYRASHRAEPVLTYTLPIHKVVGFEGFIASDATGEYMVPTTQRVADAYARAMHIAMNPSNLLHHHRSKEYELQMSEAHKLAIRLGSEERFDSRLSLARIDAWKKLLATQLPRMLHGLEEYLSHYLHLKKTPNNELPDLFEYQTPSFSAFIPHSHTYLGLGGPHSIANADVVARKEIKFLLSFAKSPYMPQSTEVKEQFGRVLVLAREKAIIDREFDTSAVDLRLHEQSQKLRQGIRRMRSLSKQATQMRENHADFMLREQMKLDDGMAVLGIAPAVASKLALEKRLVSACEFVGVPF